VTFRLSVSVKGIEELRRKYTSSALTGASQAGLGAALLQTESEAKDAATSHVRTGAYRASLGQGGTGNIRRLRPGNATFGSRIHYAQILEGGSKPHVIRPRTKKALAFPGRGGMVIRRSVNHPGTRPYHILRNAARSGRGRIARAYERQFWRSLAAR
jgi:hypothetical protein